MIHIRSLDPSRGALVALFALAACGGSGSGSTAAKSGTLAVQLTDAPFSIDSVSRVDVFVVRVDARVQTADSAEAADDAAGAHGWTTVASPNASFNLLAYQNGETVGLGEAALPAGSYRALRLVIDPSQSSVTLKDGVELTGASDPGVKFPSGNRSGLKVQLSQPIVVGEESETTVVLDFDVSQSFVLRGNSLSQHGLLFKPVIRASVHD